jgi:hypothetical protein
MATLRGKSLIAITKDIADGYVVVNPLFLKPLDAETLKELHQQIVRLQTAIRSEKFPHKDVAAIRCRNMRLQRLHNALIVLNNFMRERGLRYIIQ